MSSFLSRIIDQIVSDPVILPWAGMCYAIQLIVFLLLKYWPQTGPWTTTAMSTAYQVNALISMILQTYLGILYWFGDDDDTATNANHTLLLHDVPVHEGGRFLAQIVLGGLLESIPIGFLANPHADGALLMHLHHIGMLLVGALVMGYCSMDQNGTPVAIAGNFCPFFFGIIEASSIPLVVVDLFHPKKNPEWYHWHLERPWTQQLNAACRIVFAMLYMILRMVYFPYVVFGQVIPELSAQAGHVENAPFVTPLYSMMAFSILFTMLQLHWGWLIIQQVLKMLKHKDGDSSSSSSTKKLK